VEVSEVRDTVTVEIFGHEYKIKGEGDPEYIMEIAEYVDGKMRELAHGAQVVPPARIGILAALNIAEELFKERAEKQRIVGQLDTTTRRIRRKLEELVP
jgi:cell division protein ZapA